MKMTDQLNMAVELTPREQPFCTSEKEGWLGVWEQYGHSEEEKHFVFLLQIDPRFLGRPAPSLVTIPTELLRPAVVTSHNAQIVI
jgi:hypothetical protein